MSEPSGSGRYERKTFSLPTDVADWVDRMAEATGLPASAIVASKLRVFTDGEASLAEYKRIRRGDFGAGAEQADAGDLARASASFGVTYAAEDWAATPMRSVA
jgi:hypothetical protein